MTATLLATRQRVNHPDLERSQRRAGRLLLAPGMLLLLITTVIPLVMAAVLSFTKYDLLSAPTFVGFDNYRALFGDPDFVKSIGNTFYFAVGQVVLGLVVAFMVAMLFNRPLVGGAVMRTVIYLPQAMSYVVVALLWSFLYDPYLGPINAALRGMGIDTVNFLTQPGLAMPSIMLMSMWRNLGYFMIILLAGLKAVPEELIEASHVDGASWWYRLKDVIIPQMRNPLFFVAVTWFMGGLQMFTQSYVMTQGGPLQQTRTVVFHMYEAAFLSLNIGQASAVGVLMFLFVVVVALPLRIAQELRSTRRTNA
ncbi:carbohydrate ABC transporter permease [Aestuariimicrobium soli]|uniref:carbohydrate ABC transporter permease n=1 Tax=Aestuariimicrobium soli TaxID=2035834 RepID=UPI003EBDD3C8